MGIFLKKIKSNPIMCFIMLSSHVHFKESFNNYVDKKRGEGVRRKSTLGHVTKGR